MKSKKKGLKTHWTVLLVIVVVGIMMFGIIEQQLPRQYYVKDMKVLEATIIETSFEDNKFYFKVTPLDNQVDPTMMSDELWIEVTQQFYLDHQQGSSVGVLLSNVDAYKPKYFGVFGKKGQKLEGSSWNVEEIYPTYGHALLANPTKQYDGEASVKKKKILKNGDPYLVLEAEGRTYSTRVDPVLYNSTSVGQSLKCEFQSIGDLIKLNRIIS